MRSQHLGLADHEDLEHRDLSASPGRMAPTSQAMAVRFLLIATTCDLGVYKFDCDVHSWQSRP